MPNGIFGDMSETFGRKGGLTDVEWSDILGSIQERYTAGVGGRGLGMAAQTGMVDPYALAQQALPFQQQAMQSMTAARAEDSRRRYMEMIEEAEERAAKRQQGALLGQTIGGALGAFGGRTGMTIGAGLGTIIGGF